MLSSRANPTIKAIRALRERKERERTQSFFIEGIRLVAEAVQLRAEVHSIIVAPELLKSDFARDIAQQAQAQGAQRLDVTAEVFASLSEKSGPQGLAAVVKQSWSSLARLAKDAENRATPSLYLALESPQDPGNIGTILRTADAVGVDAVVFLGQHADPYDPEALRASMGAVFAQHLVKGPAFAELLAWARQNQLALVGTSDRASLDYRRGDYGRPLLLLMGSERQGITAEQNAACDQLVCIPMLGRSDSLNLAVATGVLLYAAHNQRHPAGSQ